MKRIGLLAIIIVVIFGCAICHAESWKQVDNSSWVDIDSIQLEPNGIIKASAREYLQDSNYYSMVLLIDGNNRKYCYEAVELYSMQRKSLGIASVDPKDKDSWMNYISDNKVIQKIIERAAADSCN